MERENRNEQSKKIIIVSVLSCLFCMASQANADVFDNMQNWQKDILFKPSKQQLEREKKGHVMIYDGLTDKMVSQALDMHFNRIESMMFTRTIVTDDKGEPEIDPLTGEVITEDDDC